MLKKFLCNPLETKISCVLMIPFIVLLILAELIKSTTWIPVAIFALALTIIILLFFMRKTESCGRFNIEHSSLQPNHLWVSQKLVADKTEKCPLDDYGAELYTYVETHSDKITYHCCTHSAMLKALKRKCTIIGTPVTAYKKKLKLMLFTLRQTSFMCKNCEKKMCDYLANKTGKRQFYVVIFKK